MGRGSVFTLSLDGKGICVHSESGRKGICVHSESGRKGICVHSESGWEGDLCSL